MRSIFCGLALTFFSLNVLGQQEPGDFSKPPVAFISPDAASLGKYGAYNVNQYTGTPDISIPLYDFKENGLEMPIRLSYDATGFIPNKGGGIMGVNWNINLGGAITRVVNGVPDDKYEPNPTADETYTHNDKGFIYGTQLGLTPNCANQSCIENLSFLTNNGFALNPMSPTGLSYEINPDVFSFNFMGHSGTFFMGNDGQVKVSSNRNYKVDVSGLLPQSNIPQALNVATNINTLIMSSIVITSDDGYKFYFGGKLNALEISFSYAAPNSRAVVANSGVINAWYITKVVTPENDEINFEYETYTADEITVLRNLTSPAGNWDALPANFFDIKLFLSDYSYRWYFSSGNSGYQNHANDVKKSLTKLVYLKKITSKLKTVTLSYSTQNETDKFYVGSPFEGYVNFNYKYNKKKLDNIYIKDNSALSVLTADYDGLVAQGYYAFTYTYYGGTNGNRLYLTGITGQSKTYALNYNRITELPNPLTKGIDIWGFYNGRTDNLRLIDLQSPAVGDPAEYETNFSYTGQYRLADPAYANVGMLKEIIYPTGGKTAFEFEGHTYSRFLKQKVNAVSGNNIIPEWVEETGNVGGCRIKTITNTPGESISYKYTGDYNVSPSGPSTGRLINKGVFRFYYDYGNSRYYEQLYDNNIAAASGYGESPVSYSEVTEVYTTANNGYTKYFFNNFETNPDNYYLGANSVKSGTPPVTNTSLTNQMNRLVRHSSRAIERGKVRKVEYYNSANTLLEKDEYVYNTNPLRFDKKTVGYYRYFSQIVDNTVGSWIISSFNLYNYHDNLTQLKKTHYDNAQAVVEITDFKYKANDNPLLIEKTITTSNATPLKTTYAYTEDLAASSIKTALQTKNMTAANVEQKQYRNNVLLMTNKNIYADVFSNGTIVKPVLNTTVNEQVASTITQENANYTYYTNGTLKDVYKTNDIKKTYLWNYFSSLPVAEITNSAADANISYSSFETADGGGWTFDNAATKPLFQSPTGTKVFDLNFNNVARTITKSGIDANKHYILSIWFKGSSISVNGLTAVNSARSNDWVLKQYDIQGISSISISGTGLVDELRFLPYDAFMKTYAYVPLYGIVTQCDANNYPTYYEYDDFGRLTLIRDQDNNILKKICYNYAGQVIDCSSPCINKVPNWQNTSTPIRCQTNACGNTGYQEQEQKDINYCSPTYNTIRWLQGSNPNACTPSGAVNITYHNNVGLAGFTAVYTNQTTNQTFTFTIPSSGTGILGCLFPGRYTLVISKPGNLQTLTFGNGCRVISGTSGTLTGDLSCNQVNIDPGF